MANVEFQDFSVKVKGVLDDAVNQFLEEAASELQSQAQRNCDFSRDLKGTWKHVVDESKKEATVGNPMQLAIWMEMGTGEYALKGNGRKGYWVYVEGSSNVRAKNPGKVLTLGEAKRQMAFLREQGLDAHVTSGHRPVRMLHNAYTHNKAKLIRRAEDLMKGLE
jgi:hypothetical protein